MGNSAERPTRPVVDPMPSFRGQPLTHVVSNEAGY